MANTDERLKTILESKAFYCDCKKVQDVDFAAQKALEAREALRAIDKIVMQPTRSDLLTLSGVLCDIRRCYYKVLED
jgi:hypothetical protein